MRKLHSYLYEMIISFSHHHRRIRRQMCCLSNLKKVLPHFLPLLFSLNYDATGVMCAARVHLKNWKSFLFYGNYTKGRRTWLIISVCGPVAFFVTSSTSFLLIYLASSYVLLREGGWTYSVMTIFVTYIFFRVIFSIDHFFFRWVEILRK